jgi:nucleoid-associated protein YgaU
MVMDAVGSAATAVGEALGLIKPEKAKLVIKGANKPSDASDIECMFNPTEYSLNQTVTVTRHKSPSKPGGTPEFAGTNAMTFSATLLFDDYAAANGDVTPKITKLLSWTKPTDDSRKKNQPCPPLVAFQWGSNKQLEDFSGLLTKVDVKYLLFRRDGTPVQADVAITITGDTEQVGGGQNPTSHATNSTRTHTVIEGETIQAVAYAELGKPAYWRAVADLNGIDDPLRLAAGSVLLIPSVADAVKSS